MATWEGVASNEVFCTRLARALRLYAAEATAHSIEDVSYLPSRRFDRTTDEDGTIHRFHQEDFFQAFGVPSEIKHQTEGGSGLKECLSMLHVASACPLHDLRAPLYALIFNLLIGNNDAHAKEIIAFARDAGLGPALVKQRESDLADRHRLQADEIDKPDHAAEALAELMTALCERHIAGRAKK
jgi:serine/threonine-protein kinase HipA